MHRRRVDRFLKIRLWEKWASRLPFFALVAAEMLWKRVLQNMTEWRRNEDFRHRDRISRFLALRSLSNFSFPFYVTALLHKGFQIRQAYWARFGTNNIHLHAFRTALDVSFITGGVWTGRPDRRKTIIFRIWVCLVSLITNHQHFNHPRGFCTVSAFADFNTLKESYCITLM